jgi:hypothetical protein
MSLGTSTFLVVPSHYHTMDTGVFTLAIARRLGVAPILRRRCALRATLP